MLATTAAGSNNERPAGDAQAGDHHLAHAEPTEDVPVVDAGFGRSARAWQFSPDAERRRSTVLNAATLARLTRTANRSCDVTGRLTCSRVSRVAGRLAGVEAGKPLRDSYV